MTNAVPEIALSISGLNKSYGDFSVIKNLNLQVQRGAIHGLVGLNGSGKTTTLECVLGMQSFNSGEVSVLKYGPGNLHEAKGDVVAIFDSPSLHPNLTVRQSLNHALLLCEKPSRSAEDVEKLLGIGKFSKFKIRNLSLGNKRRASIAQALLANPQFILLDEPFNGLDAGGVDDVLKLIKELNEQHGTSFLLSSHQLPYLEQICSHIAILHDGQIALNDKTGNLLKQSSAQVLLSCKETDAAIAVVQSLDYCELLKQDRDGYLHIALNDSDSAALNKALVDQQISVNELILERASLTSLFRQITSEAAP